MRKLTANMFHDDVMHEATRRVVFLVGLAVAIVVLHRVLYHMAF